MNIDYIAKVEMCKVRMSHISPRHCHLKSDYLVDVTASGKKKSGWKGEREKGGCRCEFA